MQWVGNLNTRPLKDSVKENIFNLLEHSKNINIKIKNSSIIDLYAGTGSFGLECLSRNASKVIFVEKDPEALSNLKKNIENLQIEKKTIIYSKNIFAFLQKWNKGKKIDIAFLDPPYSNKEFEEVIKIIKKNEILNKEHILILHRETGSLKDFNNKLSIIENRVYGRSELFFLKLFWS